MANYPATNDWPEIRKLAEQGVPWATLAENYGVEVATIRKRASREDWITPRKALVKIGSMLQREASQEGKVPPLEGATLSNFGVVTLAQSWQERADNLRNLSYRVAERAIRESEGRIVVESASDLAHAVKVARQATGLLDEKQPTINVGIFQAAEDLTGAGMPCYEAEVAEIHSVDMVDPYEL